MDGWLGQFNKWIVFTPASKKKKGCHGQVTLFLRSYQQWICQPTDHHDVLRGCGAGPLLVLQRRMTRPSVQGRIAVGG